MEGPSVHDLVRFCAFCGSPLSEAQVGYPKKVCPNADAEIYPAQSAFGAPVMVFEPN
jgi:NADH pyrophosphatase NudC (nudix superfamily)